MSRTHLVGQRVRRRNALALTCLIWLLSNTCGLAQEKKVDITFARIAVQTRGVDKEPIESLVVIYDATGNTVSRSKTGSDGEVHFNVRAGAYKAVVHENNQITIDDILVEAGEEARVSADWGKLTLYFNEPGTYASFYDSDHRRILRSKIGEGGRLSCYVSPGTYRIEVSVEPSKEFRGVVVRANKETVVGDFVNHPPRITDVSSNPSLVKAGGSAKIWVTAKDDDGDELTYSYEPNVGRVEGAGRQIVYHAPPERGTYKIQISVTDPHGGEDSLTYFVSGGDLTVRTLTGNKDPFNGSVVIYDAAGKRAASSKVGADAVGTWRLREGRYRLEVYGHNRINVPEIGVFTDRDAIAVVNFGKLTVECFGVGANHLNTLVSINDTTGARVVGSKTGEDGIISFSLRSGMYTVTAYQANQIRCPDIPVVSQKEYLVIFTPSAAKRHGPSRERIGIEQILVTPVIGEKERTFRIGVILSLPDTNVLSYEYECRGGTVSRKGNTAIVSATSVGDITVGITVKLRGGDRLMAEVLIPSKTRQGP